MAASRHVPGRGRHTPEREKRGDSAHRHRVGRQGHPARLGVQGERVQCEVRTAVVGAPQALVDVRRLGCLAGQPDVSGRAGVGGPVEEERPLGVDADCHVGDEEVVPVGDGHAAAVALGEGAAELRQERLVVEYREPLGLRDLALRAGLHELGVDELRVTFLHVVPPRADVEPVLVGVGPGAGVVLRVEGLDTADLPAVVGAEAELLEDGVRHVGFVGPVDDSDRAVGLLLLELHHGAVLVAVDGLGAPDGGDGDTEGQTGGGDADERGTRVLEHCSVLSLDGWWCVHFDSWIATKLDNYSINGLICKYPYG